MKNFNLFSKQFWKKSRLLSKTNRCSFLSFWITSTSMSIYQITRILNLFLICPKCSITFSSWFLTNSCTPSLSKTWHLIKKPKIIIFWTWFCIWISTPQCTSTSNRQRWKSKSSGSHIYCSLSILMIRFTYRSLQI